MAKKTTLKRGRQSKNAEFLRTLRQITGLRRGEFADACGKARPNMSDYLSGKKTPRTDTLRTCLESLFEWDVQPLMEIEPIPASLGNLPTDPGVYVIYDSAGTVLYIGKAGNLQTELRQTLRRDIPVAIRIGPSLKKQRPAIESLATHISLYRVSSLLVRHNLEAVLLRIFANQTHNINIGKFK